MPYYDGYIRFALIYMPLFSRRRCRRRHVYAAMPPCQADYEVFAAAYYWYYHVLPWLSHERESATTFDATIYWYF